MSKYTLAPPNLPDHLVWHKWQAYWTWISGFSLLCWVYYGQSTFFLIDPAVMPLAPWQAAAVGIVALTLGWIVYDLICKSPLARNDALLALVGFGYVVLTSWVFTLLFSGRGALIHTGALMATMMTANVFFVIMPNQRKSVAALIAGREARSEMGQRIQAALDPQQLHHAARAVHDAVEPLSRDSTPMRAIIPALVTCVIIAGRAGALFLQHAGTTSMSQAPWWAWLAAAVAMWAAFWIATAASPGMRPALGLAELDAGPGRGVRAPRRRPPTWSRSSRRAVRCATRPSRRGRGSARRPRASCSIRPEHIAAFAPAIRMQAVLTHAMPPNNLTEMTAAERAMLAPLARRYAIAGKTEGRANDGWTTWNARRARLMARLDEFAAIHRRAGQADAALSLAVVSRAPPSSSRLGARSRPGARGSTRPATSAPATRAARPSAPALMIGSHIDTVRDAGRYDGNLGALAALAVVEELAESGERLDARDRGRRLRRRGGRALSHTMTGSRALVGAHTAEALAQRDADGVVAARGA